MTECTNCRKEFQPDFNFCPHCGVEVDANAIYPLASSTRTSPTVESMANTKRDFEAWAPYIFGEIKALISATQKECQLDQQGRCFCWICKLERIVQQIDHHFFKYNSPWPKLNDPNISFHIENYKAAIIDYLNICRHAINSHDTSTSNHQCAPRCNCRFALAYREVGHMFGEINRIYSKSRGGLNKSKFIQERDRLFTNVDPPHWGPRGETTIDITMAGQSTAFRVTKPSDLPRFAQLLTGIETKLRHALYTAKATSTKEKIDVRLHEIQLYLSKVLELATDFGVVIQVADGWGEDEDTVLQFINERDRYLSSLAQPYSNPEGKAKYSLSWISSPERALVVADALLRVVRPQLEAKVAESPDCVDYQMRLKIAVRYCESLKEFCISLGLGEEFALLESGRATSSEILFSRRSGLSEAPVSPWKLSKNAVIAIREAGYQILEGVEDDAFDMRLYALDENNHRNQLFLGLDSHQESTIQLYDRIFDPKGEPKAEVDTQSLIATGGNLGDSLTPRGPFEGSKQLILRRENIETVL